MKMRFWFFFKKISLSTSVYRFLAIPTQAPFLLPSARTWNKAWVWGQAASKSILFLLESQAF